MSCWLYWTFVLIWDVQKVFLQFMWSEPFLSSPYSLVVRVHIAKQFDEKWKAFLHRIYEMFKNKAGLSEFTDNSREMSILQKNNMTISPLNSIQYLLRFKNSNILFTSFWSSCFILHIIEIFCFYQKSKVIKLKIFKTKYGQHVCLPGRRQFQSNILFAHSTCTTGQFWGQCDFWH